MLDSKIPNASSVTQRNGAFDCLQETVFCTRTPSKDTCNGKCQIKKIKKIDINKKKAGHVEGGGGVAKNEECNSYAISIFKCTKNMQLSFYSSK